MDEEMKEIERNRSKGIDPRSPVTEADLIHWTEEQGAFLAARAIPPCGFSSRILNMSGGRWRLTGSRACGGTCPGRHGPAGCRQRARLANSAASGWVAA